MHMQPLDGSILVEPLYYNLESFHSIDQNGKITF